jgi:hypothetical protein
MSECGVTVLVGISTLGEKEYIAEGVPEGL